MKSLQCTQVFSNILPCDLVFDPTKPIFELIQDFIEAKILTKFHEYLTENVASRAHKKVFLRSTQRPNFSTPHDPILDLSEIYQGKHSYQISRVSD